MVADVLRAARAAVPLQPRRRSRSPSSSCVGELGYALVAHVALAYPSGRVTDRLERAFLGVAYVVAIAFPLRDPALLRRGPDGSATSIRSRGRACSPSRGDDEHRRPSCRTPTRLSRTACSRRRSSCSSCGSSCSRPRVRGAILVAAARSPPSSPRCGQCSTASSRSPTAPPGITVRSLLVADRRADGAAARAALGAAARAARPRPRR